MTKMVRVLSVLLILVAMAAAPASAQDEKRVNFSIGGGYTFALSDIRDYLGDGYNVNLGLTFNVTPVLGIQAEYSFNGLGEKQLDVPGAEVPLFANMNMQYGNFNVVIKPPVEGKARPYVVAGMGVYYRPVKVTTPSVGYVPPYCSPWYYYCWPGGLVPVDLILTEGSSTDFGIDFGGGVTFQASEAVGIFFEARYHYIFGPELKDASGAPQGKANGQFLPITFGLRF